MTDPLIKQSCRTCIHQGKWQQWRSEDASATGEQHGSRFFQKEPCHSCIVIVHKNYQPAPVEGQKKGGD